VDIPFAGGVAEGAAGISEFLKNMTHFGHYDAPDASKPPTRIVELFIGHHSSYLP
jgi:hypothetical protein